MGHGGGTPTATRSRSGWSIGSCWATKPIWTTSMARWPKSSSVSEADESYRNVGEHRLEGAAHAGNSTIAVEAQFGGDSFAP